MKFLYYILNIFLKLFFKYYILNNILYIIEIRALNYINSYYIILILLLILYMIY